MECSCLSQQDLKIGVLEQYLDRLRTFRTGIHDGIVLDRVRDLDFDARNNGKVQGYGTTIC